MPKKLLPDLNGRIEAAIRGAPDGATIAQIAVALGRISSRRTLQRRITHLLRQDRIAAEGRGPATRYRLKPANIVVQGIESAEAFGTPAIEPYIPLSPEGENVRAWISRPITQRQPVGYDRSLLEGYRPNETYYLADAAWRERLLQIGHTPSSERVAGTYGRDILNRLLIDLSWASSRLEGNTYTRLDTQQLIEFGRAAEGKDARETQMILNHKHAIEFLIENAEDLKPDAFTLRNLHAVLSEGLLGDPGAGGRLRARPVDISGTVYRPLAVPQQIEGLFALILEKAAAIQDPFEQAFFLMVQIPYLQPFEDVNKRLSRLAANIPLVQHKLCPLSFMDVPEGAYVDGLLGIYERRRIELLRDVFVWAYERSTEHFRAVTGSLPEPEPFRLRFRAALSDVVAETVRQCLPGNEAVVMRLAGELVPDEDRRRFVNMVLDELRLLHEGNVARHRIRLSEFRAWKSRTSAT